MSKTRKILIWVILIAATTIPIVAAAMSPQLAWRSPIYIAAGFSGIVAMVLLLVQSLLAGKFLPGLPPSRARFAHKSVGILLVAAVVCHVIGLWITSPPDVMDALLFRSPTSFSVWGVIAMLTAFSTALLAIFKRRIRLRLPVWRLFHTFFAALTVVFSVVHALKIEGTMGTASKVALCILVVAVVTKLLIDQCMRLRIRVGKEHN